MLEGEQPGNFRILGAAQNQQPVFREVAPAELRKFSAPEQTDSLPGGDGEEQRRFRRSGEGGDRHPGRVGVDENSGGQPAAGKFPADLSAVEAVGVAPAPRSPVD